MIVSLVVIYVEEIAALFDVDKKTVQRWLFKEKLVEVRLKRVGIKAVPVVMEDQVAKLLDIKRPILGQGSILDKLWEDEHRKRRHASAAAAVARLAKAKAQKPTK